MNCVRGRSASYFIWDEIAQAVKPKEYRVNVYDRDGDEITDVGGTDFTELTFSNTTDAKLAVADAVKQHRSTYYPPVKAVISEVVATAEINTKPLITWN